MTNNMSDAELIELNLCPVCKVPRNAKIAPRRALQEHIKSSRDPAHIMWCSANYSNNFKHGGVRTVEITDADMLQAIRKAFGEERSARIMIR